MKRRHGILTVDNKTNFLKATMEALDNFYELAVTSVFHRANGRAITRPKDKVPELTLDKLLAEMDAYHWDYVKDVHISQWEKRWKLKYFKEILHDAELNPSGSILDIASGAISLAYLHRNTVAVDKDPRCIKELRRHNIRGVIATIPDLPLEENSFDYVTSFNPELVGKVRNQDGIAEISYDRKFGEQLVEVALQVAAKKALIVSYEISHSPPYPEYIERRVLQPLYYVVYRPK